MIIETVLPEVRFVHALDEMHKAAFMKLIKLKLPGVYKVDEEGEGVLGFLDQHGECLFAFEHSARGTIWEDVIEKWFNDGCQGIKDEFIYIEDY